MIFDFLHSHSIPYQRVDHPAVYTCEEAERFVPNLPGADTKNLFLRDGKGRNHFLLAVSSQKKVNLKALSKVLELSGLGFASQERLKKYLGLEPGSVSLLGVINDHSRHVEVLIDEDLWSARSFQCHPLVNTSTLIISRAELQRFFTLTGHKPRIVSVPALSAG